MQSSQDLKTTNLRNQEGLISMTLTNYSNKVEHLLCLYSCPPLLTYCVIGLQLQDWLGQVLVLLYTTSLTSGNPC